MASSARVVSIPVEGVTLIGDLTIPDMPKGLVLFAHGSGSSRLSTRNRSVARTLNDDGLATLLFDLLSGDEGDIDNATARLRFDIPLLANRLGAVTDWLATQAALRDMPVGYFGASTGAAAALVAAAGRGRVVRAIVSRGGRPDLAGTFLSAVRAPTLLIVGSRDPEVLAMNRRALTALGSETRHLAVVPGATHLFEEPGTMDQVSELASAWFQRHLTTLEAPALI